MFFSPFQPWKEQKVGPGMFSLSSSCDTARFEYKRQNNRDVICIIRVVTLLAGGICAFLVRSWNFLGWELLGGQWWMAIWIPSRRLKPYRFGIRTFLAGRHSKRELIFLSYYFLTSLQKMMKNSQDFPIPFLIQFRVYTTGLKLDNMQIRLERDNMQIRLKREYTQIRNFQTKLQPQP